jgi:hypothetical protein
MPGQARMNDIILHLTSKLNQIAAMRRDTPPFMGFIEIDPPLRGEQLTRTIIYVYLRCLEKIPRKKTIRKYTA